MDANDQARGGTQPTLMNSHSPLAVDTSPFLHTTTSEELDDDDELDASVDTQPMDANDHTNGSVQPTLTTSHSPLAASSSPSSQPSSPKELEDDDALDASTGTQPMDTNDHTSGDVQPTL
jgi:hypothetical protein